MTSARPRIRSGARPGVLALQGARAAHVDAFRALGLEAREVRAPEHLEGLTHLVLPGGESTTMARLLALFGLDQAIVARHRAGELALFGTCAGTILLARDCGARPATLGLLDVDVVRNAYGRQRESFTHPVRIDGRIDTRIETMSARLHGVFIRAPRITRVGAGVEVLARHGEDPVVVRAPGILATTFHPELAVCSADPPLHRAFVERDPWAAPTADATAS